MNDIDEKRPKSFQRRNPSANLVFKGVLFDVWQWEQTLWDGSKKIFESLQRPDTVLILPVTDGGEVVLAEETQPGARTVLQALGGRIEPGESPEEAARRELLEESGYVAEEFRLWDAWQPVNKIDWAVYLFVAHKIRRASSATQDAGEKIRLQMFSVESLLEQNSEIAIDDYELLHKLYYARSDERERQRVARLFDSSIQNHS